MADALNEFFFGIYPYICLVVLALGSIVRYDREPYTWRSGSSQLLRRRQLVMGSVLFHAGILIVFVGGAQGAFVYLGSNNLSGNQAIVPKAVNNFEQLTF